jgi:hypothetical protein
MNFHPTMMVVGPERARFGPHGQYIIFILHANKEVQKDWSEKPSGCGVLR